MKQTTLYLIRHGETDWNVHHRYIGKTDLSLSENGKNQIERLQEVLQRFSINSIYSSPYKRAKETAAILFSEAKPSIVIHDGLRELDFGTWEGLTYEEIKKQYAQELANWETNPLKHTTPGGESMLQVQERITKVYRTILSKHQGKNIALIGHGGSFNILLCSLLGIRPKARWQFRLSPASVSTICVHGNDPVVMKLNDISHLD